jgi:putative tryptophan/tyrosine transport system substrate-binding protein
MGIKAVAVLLVGLVLASVPLVGVQQHAKLARIGWLAFRSASREYPGTEAFRREFRALGYVEGENVAFVYRDAQGKLGRLPAVADEMGRLKVDVIVTASTASALAAKNATGTIPIVF